MKRILYNQHDFLYCIQAGLLYDTKCALCLFTYCVVIFSSTMIKVELLAYLAVVFLMHFCLGEWTAIWRLDQLRISCALEVSNYLMLWYSLHFIILHMMNLFYWSYYSLFRFPLTGSFSSHQAPTGQWTGRVNHWRMFIIVHLCKSCVLNSSSPMLWVCIIEWSDGEAMSLGCDNAWHNSTRTMSIWLWLL